MNGDGEEKVGLVWRTGKEKERLREKGVKVKVKAKRIQDCLFFACFFLFFLLMLFSSHNFYFDPCAQDGTRPQPQLSSLAAP